MGWANLKEIHELILKNMVRLVIYCVNNIYVLLLAFERAYQFRTLVYAKDRIGK